MDSCAIKKKIRVMSDIHLEHYTGFFNFENIIEGGLNDILCLVGDIGNPFSELYKTFIEWCSNNFFKVFIIAGNHEYYHSSIEKSNFKIKEICSVFFNVHFLNNSSFVIDNIIYIGSTLWSFIPNKHEDSIKNLINDYKYIEYFTPDICNKLHIESVNYIKSIIEKYKGRYKIIVLSHHSPLLSNTSKSHLESLHTNYAFSSDQSSLMKDVNLWVYGHTHYNHKNNYFFFNNTALISNQVGYPNNYAKNYNKNFYVFQEQSI